MESLQDRSNEQPADVAAQSSTLHSGVVLLGWMEEQHAVRFLLEDCWFEQGITADAASALWREWREKTASIQERELLLPARHPLSEEEVAYAEQFLTHSRTLGATTAEIIKIDPMQLVVAQHHISVDVATAHAGRCTNDLLWMEQALPLTAQNPDLSIRFSRHNLDTEIDIDLPHAEFIFGMHPHGGFGPKELMGHISVLSLDDRMLLAKGYHRLYGHILSTEGRLPQRLSVVALENSTLTHSNDPQQADSADLHIFGTRPPIFADFFTEGLAMPVYLRRKHYQLQVRAQWVAIDA